MGSDDDREDIGFKEFCGVVLVVLVTCIVMAFVLLKAKS